MRRLFLTILAGAVLASPVSSVALGAQAAAAQQATPAPVKTTYTGDIVIQAVEVLPDKAADYDQVLAKLKEALTKSARPETKAQLAGWKVIKNAAPQPNGSILYIHVIDPVVKDADYSIANNVYELLPDYNEKTAFFNTYKAAVKSVLFTIQGPMALDLSK